MRPRAASSVRPSQMVAWHTAHVDGYFVQCLPAYRRFRGIGIPWDTPAELADTTEEVAKSTRSRKVVKLAAGHFGTPLEIYVKRYNFKTWYGPYLRAVRRSRAREEFELGWALTDAGIKTPRPVWLAEDERSLPRSSIIATEAIPDAENVMQRWSRLESEIERRELLTALGRFLHLLHERGFYHDDCKAKHVLVRFNQPSAPDSFFIIDLLGGRFGKPPSRLDRAKNLYQMLRHFLPRQGSTGFRPSHREFFLQVYGGSPAEGRRWSYWLRHVGRLKGRPL